MLLLLVFISFWQIDVKAYSALEFDSENNLIMTTRDKAATGAVRYRTLGWTIKQNSKAIGAAGNASCRIKLEQASSYKDPNDSAYVITVFKVKKDVIFEKISDASEEWADSLYRNGGMVYFDGIMTVVRNGAAEGYLNSDGSYVGKVYFTYEKIAAAANWSDPSALKTHFNIPVKFHKNPEMLSGKCNISYMEAISKESFKGAKSLSKLGLDKATELGSKKYSFTAEDLSSKGYEYVGAKVALKAWGASNSEITYYGVDEKTVVVNNKNYKYRRVAVNFYYYRDDGEERYYTTADDLDKMCEKGEVKIYSDEFEVTKAIPSGEKVKVWASVQKYGLNAEYIKHSGYVSVPVNVSYYDEEGERQSFTIYVEREYSYFTLEEAYLEDLTTLSVYNEALLGGKVVFSPKSCRINKKIFGGLSAHVNCSGKSITVSDPADAQEAAERAVPYVKVRNDYLSVSGGKTYLSSNYCKTNAPEPVSDGNYMTQLESSTNIPVLTANGLYESKCIAVYSVSDLEKDIGQESGTISVNGVFVHTPVVCTVECSDEKNFNQQKTPTYYNSVILGRTITVKASCVGQHLNTALGYKGYGNRSYEKYVKKRCVSFPFDVILDGKVISAGSFTTISQNGETFKVPIYVSEGDYEIEFRIYAYNTDAVYGGEDFLQKDANLNPGNYCAKNTVKVTVTGRVFGFEVVDIIDYPRWQNVFRLADGITWSGFTYKSGTNDKDGNCIFGAGVLPLLSGSNPGSITTEGSGLGYRVRFRLKTIGNFYGPDGAICIEPQFYYTTDGKTYKEVDLYYNEKIEGSEEYFVKVGGERDKRNLKYVTLGGDGKYSITTENERLLGKYVAYSLSGEWEDIYTKTPLYSYGKIRLGRSMRVYGGCESGEGFDIKTYRAQQIWYGEYCLPPRVYVLEKGTQKENGEILSSKITGLEDEFLKDGYIVVKFNITAKRNGLSDLLYENAENAANGYCNMWSVENFGLIRKDANENIWRFEYGDVLLFDTKNGIFKDYFSMGTH